MARICDECKAPKNTLTEEDGSPWTEFCLLCGEGEHVKKCGSCNNAMCCDCWHADVVTSPEAAQ